ncbi:glycosyltransferase family 4 protein [Patescibacteria group bacterium]|nr:glycosyltransferase family 4 protein [Patescibacteria group bacterium]
MKKVLFISYFFPPIYSVESTMALNTIKYLTQYGWEPLTVASNHSREFGIDSSTIVAVSAGLNITRADSTENFISRFLNWLGIVPDAMFGWRTGATAVARELLAQHKIEAIISRANPITSHLIALTIKRIHPELPWVVLFGDPWTQNPYVKYRWPWIKPYREKIERQILNTADTVIVTTELTKQLIISKYGLAHKIHVLPNTYDPSEFVHLKTRSGTSSPVVLTYAGNFYGLRSPEPLLKALKILREQDVNIIEHLKIQFVGSLAKFINLIDQHQVGDLVKIIGQLPRARTLEVLAQSDGFISIDAGWPVPSIFLPAKLMDYLALNKPILAITPDGEVDQLIRATRTGLVASPDDPVAIANALRRIYQHQVIVNPDMLAIERYSAVSYARNLAKLLEALTIK